MIRRAAIYARVSTIDRHQDPETQLREFREYADRRSFTVVEEFVDHGSGHKDDRPNYQRLLEAVRRRRVDVVLVWRYDRVARSTQALINALNEFHSLGVDFISYHEGTDTTTPQGKLVFAIVAGLAEFESALIGDRVKAGMARAQAQGKHVGRAPMSPALRRRIEELYLDKDRKLSLRAIAGKVGVSKSAVEISAFDR